MGVGGRESLAQQVAGDHRATPRAARRARWEAPATLVCAPGAMLAPECCTLALVSHPGVKPARATSLLSARVPAEQIPWQGRSVLSAQVGDDATNH